MKKRMAGFGELCVIVVFLFIFYSIIGCPIKRLTGISCAGCGMTRAWLQLLQFHWKQAFAYHPLCLLPAVFVIACLLRWRGHEKVFRWIVGVIILLFGIVYVKRMMDPADQIVVFRPREGAMYQTVIRIYSVAKDIKETLRF